MENQNSNNVYVMFNKKLSKLQVELLSTEITPEEYNKISEMIERLKEYLVNCRSYNDQFKALCSGGYCKKRENI